MIQTVFCSVPAMQTFFTSDTHFDDQYAIQYFNHPLKNIDDMK